MKSSKRKKLEQAGWKVGSASELLGLTEAEETVVNIKLALASRLKERRLSSKMTQTQLAKRIGSSQSRVAKMEAADPSVSMELLVRSLASIGATQLEIGRIVGAGAESRKGRTKVQKMSATMK